MTSRRWWLTSVLALIVLVPEMSQARVQAHTDLRNTTACLPLASGDLLAGTFGGLVQLDQKGHLRRLWTRLDGLPGTRVHAILKEGDKLWVGTDRGLAMMTISAGKELGLHHTVATAPIRAIARHEGRLYLGTWGQGLLQLDSRARRVARVPRLSSPPTATPQARTRVTALASFDGKLHVATAGAGLWRLESGRLRRVEASDHLPSPFVWSLATSPVSGGSHLFAGTLAGLASIDRSGRVDQLHAADLRALAIPAQGERIVLAGSYGQGLFGLAAPTGRARNMGTGSDALKRAFVNGVSLAHGTLCVGTRDGLWLGRGAEAVRRAQLLGPVSNDISALARDGQRLYVGTFDQGLSVLDTSNGRWQRITGVDRRIDALLVQGSILWAGTPRGLYRVSDHGDGRRERQVRRFGRADGLRHEHVHSLALLRDGGVLAGTGLGAVILSEGGRRVEPINVKQGLPVASVWAAAEDSEGMLWIGTSKGLYRWSRSRRRYARFSVSSGHLSDDWVTALAIDGRSIYVGTYNAGVCLLSKNKAAAGEWRSKHLGGGWINFAGLTIRTRTLYAATMKGLRSLSLDDIDKGGDTQIKFKLVDRAAPGKDVTAVLEGPGGLWIASRRGLARR
jgi:ligand-binding sensor domain-containing protein